MAIAVSLLSIALALWCLRDMRRMSAEIEAAIARTKAMIAELDAAEARRRGEA